MQIYAHAQCIVGVTVTAAHKKALKDGCSFTHAQYLVGVFLA